MSCFMTCATCSLDIVPRAIHDKEVRDLRALSEARINELLDANNRLTGRARKAEQQRDAYFEAIACLTKLCARLADRGGAP